MPIHEDPPTARALLATVEIGREIHPEHYRAVAAAIRFSDKMRAAAGRGARRAPRDPGRAPRAHAASWTRARRATSPGSTAADRGPAPRRGDRCLAATGGRDLAEGPLPLAEQGRRLAWAGRRIGAAGDGGAQLAAEIRAARAEAVQSLGKHKALEHLAERADRAAAPAARRAPSARRRRRGKQPG